MILAIDCGNTRAKWGLHDGAAHGGDGWRRQGSMPLGDLGRLETEWQSLPQLSSIAIAHVAGSAAREPLAKALRRFEVQPIWVCARSSQCGVTNGYADPAQLGADRWAALIGARHAHPGPSLVVSAGTASGAILSFPINTDGSLGSAVVNTGLTAPFAGAFLPQKTNPIYLATSASQGSLAEFTDTAGLLNQVSTASTTTSAPGVAAPCWLVLSPDGTIAFVGNGSGAISTYAVSPTSGLTLLNATAATEPGVKSGVTSVAADSWVSSDGKFLYTAYLGDDKVVAYSIGLNGSLAKIGETVIGTSTGISIQGLTGI